MKRTLSLVLSLTLLLGLLPGTVLAEGVEIPEPALPDGYRQAYGLPGVGYGGERVSYYTIEADTQVLFKFAPTKSGETLDFNYYSVDCDTEIGRVNLNGDKRYAIFTAASYAASGYIYIENNENRDIRYAFPVTVSGAVVGEFAEDFSVYDAAEGGNELAITEGRYTLEFTDTDRSMYLIPNGSISVDEDSLRCGDGMIVPAIENGSIKLKLNNGIYGTRTARVTFSADHGAVTYAVEIAFVPKPNNPDGGNPPQDDETLISEEHDRKEEDTYYGDFNLQDGHLTASFNVTSSGTEYTVYMIPQGPNFEIAHASGSNEPTLTRGQQQNLKQGIGFFLKDNGDSYRRIVEDDLLIAIKQAVGDSLDLQLLAMNDIPGNSDFQRSEIIPAIYKISDTETSFHNICLKMGLEHRGFYIFRATCTVNEKLLVSETRLEWRPTLGYAFTPDMSAQKDPIAQINEFLAGLNYDENASVIVNLPAGEFTGYIIVPAKLGRMRVFVNGTRENGSIKTTLNGGLETLNFSVNTRYINFVGAGAGQKNWANDHANSGRPNYALYGGSAISGNDANFGGGSHSENCMFTGYDIAIYSTCRLRTVSNNLFKNNNVAICYDTQNDDGGSSMNGNEFNGNTIGIHFKNLNKPGWFVLTGTKFIDNVTDIRNDLNRNIYMPGCYFAGTVNSVETIRECRYLPVAKGNLKKQVLYYPQAETRECNSFVFRTGEDENGFDLYKFDPVVSTNFTKTFPIPTDALNDATFVVKKDDKLLARFIFD